MVKLWVLTPNDEDVLLFTHQTSSVKHHLTETYGNNFEIHNIVLSSKSISLIKMKKNIKTHRLWQRPTYKICDGLGDGREDPELPRVLETRRDFRDEEGPHTPGQ